MPPLAGLAVKVTGTDEHCTPAGEKEMEIEGICTGKIVG
jgi:hypothetical protein